MAPDGPSVHGKTSSLSSHGDVSGLHPKGLVKGTSHPVCGPEPLDDPLIRRVSQHWIGSFIPGITQFCSSRCKDLTTEEDR